ncbi:MAG: Membrane fusion component of tripartite multidrug resistance system, partial [Proteobacteria bacterium]|nr:Membrane fusion component of tripartite multidrug resistance system [Pseudomonadota bacterium]
RAAAQLELSRTEIRAPMAGRIGQADRLQLGQQVLPNLPILTLVGTQDTYIEANFKETDLADMKVGQRTKITFDAYPGLELRGHVASIGAGTNSVTQRVPVRIVLDQKSPRPLIAGLSTHITVYTDGRRH